MEITALSATEKGETTSKQQHESLISHNLLLNANISVLFLCRSLKIIFTTQPFDFTHVNKCRQVGYTCQCSSLQRLPNGSIDAHDDGGRVSELQELLDRTNKELAQSREHAATLNGRMVELEAELANARRELSRSEELSIKQQREQREVRLNGVRIGRHIDSDTWIKMCEKL